jgi:hypothetical protein
MGNIQSSTMKSVVDAVNQTTTNVKNTSITDGKSTTLNRNTLSFEVGDKGTLNLNNCPLNIAQKITTDQNLKVLAKFSSATDLQNTLKSIVDQASSGSQKAVNDFLSLGVNAQTSKQDLITNIKNSITNNITNENVTKCNAILDNLNDGKIVVNGTINCKDGKFDIDQSIISNQQVDCISESLFNAALKNQAINDIVQKAENQQSAENKGLGSFLQGIWLYIVIALGAVLLIGVIALVIFFIIRSSSNKKGTVPLQK